MMPKDLKVLTNESSDPLDWLKLTIFRASVNGIMSSTIQSYQAVLEGLARDVLQLVLAYI